MRTVAVAACAVVLLAALGGCFGRGGPEPSPTGTFSPYPSPSGSLPPQQHGDHVDYTSTAEGAQGGCRCSSANGVDNVAWESADRTARADLGVSFDAEGSVTVRVFDATGAQVLERRLDRSDRTFSGPTADGQAGAWRIELAFEGFTGIFSFDVGPA